MPFINVVRFSDFSDKRDPLFWLAAFSGLDFFPSYSFFFIVFLGSRKCF